MELFLFLLSCIGATFIINISYLFKPLREGVANISPFFGKLLKCSQCMGFWIGIFIRFLFMWHENQLIYLQWSDLYNICYGFASSFVCYASYLLLEYFMEKYD